MAWQHEIKKYDGKQPLSGRKKEDVVFRFHFPRGVLSREMSAFEISGFVLKHLFAMEYLVAHMPVVHRSLLELRNRFVNTPESVLDEVYGWCKVEWHKEEDDVVVFAPIWIEEDVSMQERADAAKPVHIDLNDPEVQPDFRIGGLLQKAYLAGEDGCS